MDVRGPSAIRIQSHTDGEALSCQSAHRPWDEPDQFLRPYGPRARSPAQGGFPRHHGILDDAYGHAFRLRPSFGISPGETDHYDHLWVLRYTDRLGEGHTTHVRAEDGL